MKIYANNTTSTDALSSEDKLNLIRRVANKDCWVFITVQDYYAKRPTIKYWYAKFLSVTDTEHIKFLGIGEPYIRNILDEPEQYRHADEQAFCSEYLQSLVQGNIPQYNFKLSAITIEQPLEILTFDEITSILESVL